MPNESFLKSDPEIRRAEAVLEQPNWIVGHRTQIGLALTVLGMIGKQFHKDIPVDQIGAFLDLLNQNWAGFCEIAGAALAIYGNIKKTFRHEEAKATVAVLADKLVDTKDELATTKAEVTAAKADLHEANKVITELKTQ